MAAVRERFKFSHRKVLSSQFTKRDKDNSTTLSTINDMCCEIGNTIESSPLNASHLSSTYIGTLTTSLVATEDVCLTVRKVSSRFCILHPYRRLPSKAINSVYDKKMLKHASSLPNGGQQLPGTCVPVCTLATKMWFMLWPYSWGHSVQ